MQTATAKYNQGSSRVGSTVTQTALRAVVKTRRHVPLTKGGHRVQDETPCRKTPDRLHKPKSLKRLEVRNGLRSDMVRKEEGRVGGRRTDGGRKNLSCSGGRKIRDFAWGTAIPTDIAVLAAAKKGARTVSKKKSGKSEDRDPAA